MSKKIRTEAVDYLFSAILSLQDKEECYTFFEDICTINELLSLSQRFEVAKMLRERRTYLEIAEKTGASTATISRVNRSLNYGNDGYDMVFERQLSGLGNAGDVFVPISTSGNSINLVHTVKTAKKMGIWTIGLLGKTGGKLKELCDYALVVPSEETPRIQEIHTFSVHMLCESIEKQIFEKSLCK